VGLDSLAVHGGRFALHVSDGDDHGYCMIKQTSGILRDLRGKHVTYRGWLRMAGSVRSAGIALRAIGHHDSLLTSPFAGRSNDGPRTEWQQLTIESLIDTSAVDLEFGVFMQGNGDAWFDDLGIDTNGIHYAR
jgi:hypothetical protein